MPIDRTLNTTPRIRIEIPYIGPLMDVIARVYIADANGTYPASPQGWLEFFGPQGNQYEHLVRMLEEAGLNIHDSASAAAWLQNTPKDQAMATLRLVWNRFLTELCALINKFIGASPSDDGVRFLTMEDLLDAMLEGTNFQIVNGKITATF